IRDSFPKLDPRSKVRNPVMFIVELGSVITTVTFFLQLARGEYSQLWFVGVIAFWLWLTVLFANFAEAIAEGRGKAQADALRATRTTTVAHRRTDTGGTEDVPAPDLQRGDIVVVSAGEIIPADGEAIEGVGSVDESAITGESAPVIREAGGDRSAVTGGTRLLSDRRAPVRDRHRRHRPASAAQRPRDVRTRSRGVRRRRRAAARQDRHDHARQPAGDRVRSRRRRLSGGARRSRSALLTGRRDA